MHIKRFCEEKFLGKFPLAVGVQLTVLINKSHKAFVNIVLVMYMNLPVCFMLTCDKESYRTQNKLQHRKATYMHNFMCICELILENQSYCHI